ncbi:hypothetical protein MVEG_10618 [Podila verticillata NRRL 6337]|nr:hypothetical protein MVEG_10618 [Podila verticillata NRRL 6337]
MISRRYGLWLLSIVTYGLIACSFGHTQETDRVGSQYHLSIPRLHLRYPFKDQFIPLARQGQPFLFTFLRGSFVLTPENEDTSRIGWKYELESPSPAWLKLDSATRTFSGSPTEDDKGEQTVSLRVTPVGVDHRESEFGTIFHFSVLVAKGTSIGFAPPTIINSSPISNQLSTSSPHLSRRALSARSVTGASKVALTERFANAVVVEGQTSPFRVVLDPSTFVVTPDALVSSGPISYTARLETSTALPIWLIFDPYKLEFTGVPLVGTYAKTSYITVVVSASTVPGYTQSTDRFTIKVVVHTLSLSTSPLRACSSSAAYYSKSLSTVADSLPDLYIDTNRHFRYELSMDLFRTDDCMQPARPEFDSSTNVDHSIAQTPVTITNVTIELLPDSTMDTLPSWITFNSTDWTISGTAPSSAPARITLQVYMADSFKTSSVFKLHIYTNGIPPLEFHQPIPDQLIRIGHDFKLPLNLDTLLQYPKSQLTFPLESRFSFQVVDISTQDANTSLTGTLPPSPNLTLADESMCSSAQLWRYESDEGDDDQRALFLNWFNYPTMVTADILASREGTTLFLSGIVPCSIILRVRWTLKATNEQHASTEFMIWVSDQVSPPFVLADPHSDDSTSQGSVGPLGIKIIIALAVALPMLLAIWFIITRYCRVIKQEQELENQPPVKVIDKVGGFETSPSPDWNGYHDDDDDDDNGQGARRRRDQHSSEAMVLREPHCRPTYDDDPSVGHRDSFSQKYAAENGILTYTTEDTEQDSRSVRPSERRSILGWIFRETRSPSAQTSDLQSTDGTRVRTGDLADFSLKRVSVGYPFESSSFRFVGSNRSTFYDSSTTVPNRHSAVVECPTYLQVPHSPAPLSPIPLQRVPAPEGQKANQNEPDTPQPSHVQVEPDFVEQIEMQEVPELPVLPETTARKLRRSLRLGTRKRPFYQDTPHCSQVLLVPGIQSTRPCHSFESTGSGYIASMSGSNTSDSGRNSLDESSEQQSEETINIRRQRSRERLRMASNDEYDSESRASWASYEEPKDMELIQDDTLLENEHKATIKRAATSFPRSDSGVMGSSSSSIPNLKVFLRKPKTALSALTVLRPTRSMVYLGQGGSSSDTDSFASIRTAPVGFQGVYARDRGLSVHVNNQRQSAVEVLSQGVPISPLSAVSAGLPIWSVLDGDALQEVSTQSGSSPRSRAQSEKELFCGPELEFHETSIPIELPVETLEWVEGQDIRLASSVSQSWDDSNVSRHFSLQSELGIIEQAGQEDAQTLPSFPPGEDLALSRSLGSSCPSGMDKAQSHTLAPKESLSRKPSSERMRPISYPVLFNNACNNVPRNIVKATIGTAFHYAATIRQSMSSTLAFTPSSPRVPKSPSQGPSGLKAYLVSDPQTCANTDQACDLARINSLDLERGPQNEYTSQTSFRKTLPEWIQFNSKMRSLWGRPIAGTAGEWQVSLVQPLSLAEDKDLDLLRSVSPTDDQAGESTKGEVEVERVVLLIREQGATPSNSPPLLPTRSRTLPSLMLLTDVDSLFVASKAIEIDPMLSPLPLSAPRSPIASLLESPTTLDRTVGQRVLAERRRLEAAQAQQEEQQAQ